MKFLNSRLWSQDHLEPASLSSATGEETLTSCAVPVRITLNRCEAPLNESVDETPEVTQPDNIRNPDAFSPSHSPNRNHSQRTATK